MMTRREARCPARTRGPAASPREVHLVVGTGGHFDSHIGWVAAVHATRAGAEARAAAVNALASAIVDAADRGGAIARLHAADVHHAAFPLAQEEETFERLVEPGTLYTVETWPLECEPGSAGEATR